MAATCFLLIDTNAFLRLYFSPVLPLLGEVIGGYKLMTLESLVGEFLRSDRLKTKYASVAVDPKLSDLTTAQMKLRGTTKSRVDKERQELLPYARALVDAERRKGNNLTPPTREDVDLLATAVVLKGGLATDEGALRFVAHDLMEDPDSYPISLFSSLEVLHLLEANGRLTANDRRATVQKWIREDELLPKNWRSDYKRLFDEPVSSITGS
ncbi:hypothetical protein RY831_03065 [Noviherbaspirillum sp. CPCC 100848]|uniref:DUF4935 domain-containing protein n=1 Tax=Noviherbaspirillum album TaxID=3080276 RepID=A0ABU6J3C1_9BURK|nr:hypothetical protein [Noviherbaspirillum sp. CPCC 100848]MEC4718112.1 hypothetical protein [Noviherbaspirillum sp. CPCC 100848]